MNIFGYIKVGKRISKAHKALFTHKTMVLWYKGKPEHRNDARWLVVSTRLERNVGTINVPVRSNPRLILTFTL